MKKLIAFALGALVAVTAFAFTGCSKEDELGVIGGNYKEATAEELKAALANIDSANMFGNVTEDEFSFGFALTTSIEEEITSDAFRMSESAEADVRFTMKANGEETEYLGSGTATIREEQQYGGFTLNMDYGAQAYLDSDAIYLSLSDNNANKTKKVKASLDELIAYALGELEMFPPATDGTDAENFFDAEEFLRGLEDYHIDAYLDTSDGVKIKLSATEQTVFDVIDEAVAAVSAEYPGYDFSEMLSPLVESLEFTSMQFDFYLTFDKDGRFSGIAANTDMEFSVDTETLPSFAQQNLGVVTFRLKEGITLKAFDGAITLPAGIAEDEDYIVWHPEDDRSDLPSFGLPGLA